jgi:mannose-6-phosphate isomerase-like protein (cupin superfamily)
LSDREIVCEELNAGIDDLRRQGFRLDLIYPADDPVMAVLSNGPDSVRLTTRPGAPAPSDRLPPFAAEFVLTRAGAASGLGRAGMLYRDLIPGRLGGRYIASHITITEGGPVEDWVHYHRLALQMIYVRRGWVRVVYQDAGEPFVMREGDLVIQPPEIRHRVLESSPGLEVIEVSAPAVHATYADHGLELPNGSNPGRIFGGQRFLRHIAAETPWTPANGGEAQETEVEVATSGLAEVRTLRPRNREALAFGGQHGELVFGFVLDGSAALDYRGIHEVGPADAFVIPPGQPWRLTNASADLRLLHVTTGQLD